MPIRRGVATAILACLAAALAACGSTVHLPALPTASSTPPPLCGAAGDWTASQLAAAILPPDAVPAPFKANADRTPTLAEEKGSQPSVIADALTGFTAGYRRDWLAPKAGAGFVELWAFSDEREATGFEGALVAFFAGNGVSGTPSDAIPSATEYLSHGQSGDSHALVAERDRVVMEIGIGGPGITQASTEDLARTQYDRICRH
jgi:hypothetical protein